MSILVKDEKDISDMREAGKKLAKIMGELEFLARPNVSTLEIDKLAEKLVFDFGGKPAFKGYVAESGIPFPATICASLNEEIVHGIPRKDAVLREGDLLKIDIGMKYQDVFVDMARTFLVGGANNKQARRLMEVVKKAFWEGIRQMKAGKKISDYSKAVQKLVEKNNFSVVRSLVGHGIGRNLHEDPQIPNYYNRKFQDVRLASGMTLALEPMINAGKHEIILDRDGWTFKTMDGSLSAHYENTVVVTESGADVLTIL